MDVTSITALADRAGENIERVIVGKRDVIDLLLVAVLCEGHVLIEDVPGIGKTMLARSLARTLDCSFKRIQFTPDLLPSDVTGVSFFNQRLQEFEFRPGPIFSQIVLADEINRATPRTQSALLECMEERQVTVEGDTRPLPRPFLVLATQNPIELGASPRATLALYRASQALAAIDGRAYVLPDDVKRLAPAVLAHRLITTAQSRLRGRGAADVLNEVLATVPVPVEEPLT